MISTKGKAAWAYGRFEIRAKLPTQQGVSKGLWPAFWLRPTDGGAGELDAVEAIGGDAGSEEWNQIHHTIWFDYDKSYPKESKAVTFPRGSPSDGFHTYVVKWRKASIRWYVDGRLTYVRDRQTTPWLDEAFNRPSSCGSTSRLADPGRASQMQPPAFLRTTRSITCACTSGADQVDITATAGVTIG